MKRLVRLLTCVICLAFCAAACHDATYSGSPTAPSSAVAVTQPVFTPVPSEGPRTTADYTRISLGQTVSGRVTPDDPQCDPNWPQHCGGFLLTVPTEGILAVVLTWNPEVRDGYPLDFDVFDPERKLVWYSAASGRAERRVQQVQVQAGVTYPITVWSAYMPGEPFEISMSFLPK